MSFLRMKSLFSKPKTRPEEQTKATALATTLKLISEMEKACKVWQLKLDAEKAQRDFLGLSEIEDYVIVPRRLLTQARCSLEDYGRYRANDQFAYGPANNAMNEYLTKMISDLKRFAEQGLISIPKEIP